MSWAQLFVCHNSEKVVKVVCCWLRVDKWPITQYSVHSKNVLFGRTLRLKLHIVALKLTVDLYIYSTVASVNDH